MAFWPTAIVKRDPSRTYGEFHVAGTGDATAPVTKLPSLRFSPEGCQQIAGGKPRGVPGTSPKREPILKGLQTKWHSTCPASSSICLEGLAREPARPSDQDVVPKLSAVRCRASSPTLASDQRSMTAVPTAGRFIPETRGQPSVSDSHKSLSQRQLRRKIRVFPRWEMQDWKAHPRHRRIRSTPPSLSDHKRYRPRYPSLTIPWSSLFIHG